MSVHSLSAAVSALDLSVATACEPKSFHPLSSVALSQIEDFRAKCQEAAAAARRHLPEAKPVEPIHVGPIKSALKSAATKTERVSFRLLAEYQVFTSDDENYNIIVGRHEGVVDSIGRVSVPGCFSKKFSKLPRCNLSSTEVDYLDFINMIECPQRGLYPLARLEFFRGFVVDECDHELRIAIYQKLFSDFNTDTIEPYVLHKLNQVKLELFQTFPKDFQAEVNQRICEKLGNPDGDPAANGWAMFQAAPSDKVVAEAIDEFTEINFSIDHLLELTISDDCPMVKAEYVYALINDPSINLRTKIQNYSLLFAPRFPNAGLGGRDLARLSEIKAELFDKMPIDFQEDVNYRIWNALGRPVAHSPESLKTYFNVNSSTHVVSSAIYVACLRPRYTATSPTEKLESSLDVIGHYISQFSFSQPQRAKLYAFQALEIALHVERVNPRFISNLFIKHLDHKTQCEIFVKMTSINPEVIRKQAEEMLKYDSLNPLVVAAVRAIKDEFLDQVVGN